MGPPPPVSMALPPELSDLAELRELSAENWQRILTALRYQARDLHHRSYAVSSDRRELLWGEMDACLALADRLERLAQSLGQG